MSESAPKLPAAATTETDIAENLAEKYVENKDAIKGVDDLRAKGAAHEDPAEAKYIASLLGKDVVREDGRRVVVEEFRIIVENQKDDKVYTLSKAVEDISGKPFSLVEGCNWKLQLKFKCYGKELIAGLTFATIVGKGMFKVADKLTIGSFAPNGQENTYVYPRHGWNEAPSGFFKRGSYAAEFKLLDADNTEHQMCKYGFSVVKK